MSAYLSCHRRILGPLAWLAAAAAVAQPLPAASPAVADQDAKTVSVDATPADTALAQWVTTVVVATPPVAPPQVITLPLATAPAAATPRFEPRPVILGTPDLPLLGAGVRQAGRQWAAGFNYQGMHVRLISLDAAGRPLEARPLSMPPLPGERFKLRVTATFDALAEVDLVLGNPFSSQASGQLYPAPGFSVQMRAGENVDLPMHPQEYFMLGAGATQRLLLQVRHAAATDSARSQQPAYRQDGVRGSNFLQLVPRGNLPAFEQLVATAER